MLSLELFLIHKGNNIKTQHEIEHEIGNFLSCLSNNFSPSFALATFCKTHTHTQKQSLAFDHTKVITKQSFNKNKLHLQPHKILLIIKDTTCPKKNTKKCCKTNLYQTFLENPWKNCYKTKFHKLCLKNHKKNLQNKALLELIEQLAFDTQNLLQKPLKTKHCYFVGKQIFTSHNESHKNENLQNIMTSIITSHQIHITLNLSAKMNFKPHGMVLYNFWIIYCKSTHVLMKHSVMMWFKGLFK